MTGDDAIVQPLKGRRPPTFGRVAAMVATRNDLNVMLDQLGASPESGRSLFLSQLHLNPSQTGRFALVGPVMGASYAAAVLESLIVWGAEQILFLGWCGAVSPLVRSGDLILPSAALIDEGTSRHYQTDPAPVAIPTVGLHQHLRALLKTSGADFHEGLIWTTDAIFRETPSKVKSHQRLDVLGVEMELSALFTVAAFRQVQLAGLLVVSDELSRLSWQAGFKCETFHKTRQRACRLVLEACRTLATPLGVDPPFPLIPEDAH